MMGMFQRGGVLDHVMLERRHEEWGQWRVQILIPDAGSTSNIVARSEAPPVDEWMEGAGFISMCHAI
eukprot:jgi/Botrbrau1/15179/Bobra.0149s0044.1